MRYEDMVILAQREARKHRKKPVQHEESLQDGCVRWFDLEYPELRLLLFHAANEGKVSIKQAARRKKMGVRAGVSDLILLIPRAEYTCLCIELKYKYNSQSESQEIWQKVAEAYGRVRYVVVKSIDDFIKEVNEYLKLD